MYYFSTTVALPMEQAIKKLTEILHNNKLGIVSDVNVQAILKTKMGIEYPAYRLLGACNPGLAKRVLDAQPQGGALLPCTIVAREEGSGTSFDFMDPETVLQLANNEEINAVASEAKQMLNNVRAELEK